jgi:hypothetical protein
VSFGAITICVASQRLFIFVVFRYDSVRKLLDIPLFVPFCILLVHLTARYGLHIIKWNET